MEKWPWANIHFARKGRGMEYINPLFSDSGKVLKDEQTRRKRVRNEKNGRAVRSDKTHSIKFPVTPVSQMKLRSHLRQAKRLYPHKNLTQTTFNTLLLRYGMNHPEIIKWNQPYRDTKVYMHTKILKKEYEIYFGPHGFSVQKNMSDRKAVHHIILSVLSWLERGGTYEEIIQ